MKIIVPCKDKADVERMSGMFGGKEVRRRTSSECFEIDRDIDGLHQVHIFIHNPSAICGLRGHAIVVRSGVGITWDDYIPMLSIPEEAEKELRNRSKHAPVAQLDGAAVS